MWEDPRNNEGGRWLISLDKKQRTSDLDSYWLEVVCVQHSMKENFANIFFHFEDFVFNWGSI